MDTGRVLLTGGCGLVGRALAPLLRQRYEVTHYEVRDPGDGLPFMAGDLRDPARVAAACAGMDAVVHIAALHGRAWQEAGDDDAFEVNVTGTKNVLEAAVRAGVRRVVFTSSIWANGHGAPAPSYLPIDEEMPRQPAELYGLTKVLGEAMCRYAGARHGLSTIVLRPGGIRPATAYGPNQAAYLTACVDVRDVAQAHLLALRASASMLHEVFVITADSPLCRVDAGAYRADPAAALESVIPGGRAAVRDGRCPLPRDAEWYTVQKAKRHLGYRPEFNFVLA
ncbi:MAG: NAD(P)-dependent oxidoreductase [Lentisphaeria bacterium]|nr:NAD(P)-dependent oxidoreductase [Lentisphaeria bacterium]